MLSAFSGRPRTPASGVTKAEHSTRLAPFRQIVARSAPELVRKVERGPSQQHVKSHLRLAFDPPKPSEPPHAGAFVGFVSAKPHQHETSLELAMPRAENQVLKMADGSRPCHKLKSSSALADADISAQLSFSPGEPDTTHR